MLSNTPNPLDYQQFINGVVYGFQDITLTITTDKTIVLKDQFESIDYDWDVDKQELTGLSPVPVGYTAGKASFKGSVSVSLQHSNEICEALAASANIGISRVPFTITVSYGPIAPTGQFARDVLYGCFIKSGSNSHSASGALRRKHDFVFCNLSQNGVSVV